MTLARAALWFAVLSGGCTLRMTTVPVHRTWTELVPLVQAGRLDTTGVFTHTFALDDAAVAYAAAASRSDDCLKVRLTP